MALEPGVVYIEDLVATNPVGATDNVDEGDDHIRNIKTAVQGSFPSLGAAAVTKTAAEINDLATLTGTETLTNKTISGGTVAIDSVQATTSGTTVDFTSLPTWTKKITISFDAVSVSAAASLLFRIGDSDGVDSASTYKYGYHRLENTSLAGAAATSASSILLGTPTANANGYTGHVTVTKVDTGDWVVSWSIMANAGAVQQFIGSGSKTIDKDLDRVQVSVTTGTFDSGQMNILYEG